LGKAPISAKLQLTFPEPFTDLPVEPIVKVRAVPQFTVVIFTVQVNGKRFTACKKLSINGFTYWNLKGWDGSVNHHIYIGKADQVTVDKLTEAALAMITKCRTT